MIKSLLATISLLFFSVGFCQDKLVEQANKKMDAGDFDSAMKLYNQAISEHPNDHELYVLRGNAFEQMSQPQQAFDDFTTSIALEPKNPKAFMQRGLFLLHSGYPEQALEDVENGLKFVGNDAKLRNLLWLTRGDSHLAMQNPDEAYKNFILVLDSKPETAVDIAAHLGVARALSNQHKHDQAVIYLEKLVKLYPDFESGYVNLVFQLSEAGNYKRAIEVSDNAIEMAKKRKKSKVDKVVENDKSESIAMLYNNRGYAKYKAGDLKGALIDIDSSISLSPTNSYAFRNRALVNIASGKIALACADIEKALKLGFSESYGDEVTKLKATNCH
ncbi:tetratricopeptide repeat protein [Flavobacterium sp.]|uniref:tetratricopeptide repeat protein n=1 Tax=Flavobacterium sp. TaxID=239 RepID=UPI001201AA1B|nr:tetratricopeptide repeat protein [Flavobacterium sp.]RZJ72413.1 MAG: tetratricopeptide repeat protein [Flavobacterium sp.]